ncbi:hypothetical protein SAMD00019534_059370 [Acytostelium subglobosum LB1]|uniref:hypothetical protein n=1 Tax=Acytostelium subglobosum LB1 TaxID=1410327 RepID=UPI0006451313|nr:hypothetical protein SAMD00019534_059370 [Acytostelium subglobosum LB1]GAM22762.1 hypothetical protein SAMD00019534_059370 [Acytostelium subglobosum LB1]|eukprot:XP_012753989.1 hypothetical protein SAMD00019534_059370 [Acytostelium subglobosum LB1]
MSSLTLKQTSSMNNVTAIPHSMLLADDDEVVVAAPRNQVIEGELVKEGHVFKNWKTRWFRLEDGYLLYFKSKNSSSPIDKVPLRGSRVSKKPFHHKPNCFELMAVSMRKIFLLQAKSAREVDFWVNEIEKAGVLARSPSSPSLK